MANEKFNFICQSDEAEIFILNKEGVDNLIKESENDDRELDFKVIGKIPERFFTADIREPQIQWYEKAERDKPFVDKVLLTIIQTVLRPALLNG